MDLFWGRVGVCHHLLAFRFISSRNVEADIQIFFSASKFIFYFFIFLKIKVSVM